MHSKCTFLFVYLCFAFDNVLSMKVNSEHSGWLDHWRLTHIHCPIDDFFIYFKTLHDCLT